MNRLQFLRTATLAAIATPVLLPEKDKRIILKSASRVNGVFTAVSTNGVVMKSNNGVDWVRI